MATSVSYVKRALDQAWNTFIEACALTSVPKKKYQTQKCITTVLGILFFSEWTLPFMLCIHPECYFYFDLIELTLLIYILSYTALLPSQLASDILSEIWLDFN